MYKLYISEKSLAGDGLFAGKKYKKGEKLFVVKGTMVHVQVQSKEDSNLYPYAIGINRQKWLNPFVTCPLYFTNHSCRPNAGIKGAVTFVALRDIEPGEEITLDYSITEEDTLWSLDCLCGSDSCRHVIRSIQFLPLETFKSYLPYVPNHFKKVYMKAHNLSEKDVAAPRQEAHRGTAVLNAD